VKHTRQRFLLLFALSLLILAAGAFWYLRGRNSPPIAAAGGRAFTNFAAIETPFYLQRDQQWKNETIGSGETLAREGRLHGVESGDGVGTLRRQLHAQDIERRAEDE
jgi:hypothetical protein